jgi:hypothetical protein
MSVRPTPTPNLTVRFQIRNIAPPASNAALATTKLLLFPTQFVSNIPGSGYVFNCATGLGLLKNFGLRAATAFAGGGVLMGENGRLENIVVANYATGLGCNNGLCYLVPVCAANGCEVGISAGPAGAFNIEAPTLWKRLSWSGCRTYGIWIVGGSYTGGNGTFTYVCSNATGIRADTKGLFLNGFQPGTTGGIVVAFNDRGVVAVALGVVLTALTAQNSVAANITWDALASAGSQISIIHNVNTAGRYSPANEVLGPDGGYISIQTP